MTCDEPEQVKVTTYWKPTECKRVVEKGDFVRFGFFTGFWLLTIDKLLDTIILASLPMGLILMIRIIVGELTTRLLVPVG